MKKVLKVTLVNQEGEKVEVEKSVSEILVLRYGYRNMLKKSDDEIEADKLALETKGEKEKEDIRKILTRMKVEFHPQLGLSKLKLLLDKTLSE